MSSLRLLFFLLIFSFTPTHSFHHDGQSLLAFKNLITSDPWHSMADWSPANPFCNWTGVTCDRHHPNRVASLNLTKMDLRGSISPSLANLSFFRTLDLSGNALTGHIPTQLGRLFRLRKLELTHNELEGNIPNQLSSCRKLTFVSISFNNLTGNIPREFGSLPHLQKLYLGENDLTGAIPSSLGNLSSLIHLTLEYNSLTGSIPSQLSSCRNLTLLLLQDNDLRGTIPSSLGNLSSLVELYIGDNNLVGSIPQELGRLTHLEDLILSDNYLSGTIPYIGNLSSLSFLDLSENILNGSVSLLGKLEKIERLNLSNNRLEGNIPDDFESLQHLGLLDISGNILSGKIPNSLASLKQLRRLHLHHNKLSGSIPSNLVNCINLELLDLSHNRLTGSIPHEIAKLSHLQFYLNLSWNLLEGSLPMEIGKIAMAQAIDISANQLTGVIPPALGSCSELQLLNLSHNAFQGSIPDSIGNLLSLMNLDLSSNSLSGAIPIVSLQKLKMLQSLNLSFNNLTGEIPKGGFFANKTVVMSLIGNPNLCGPRAFQLPSCQTRAFQLPACQTPRGHFAFVKKVLFLVSGAFAFILSCLLLGFLWKRNMHIQNFHSSQSILQKLEHRRISYQELHIATDGFVEANLLGTGNFGLVYKGILSDGTLVAVKVFQLLKDKVEKSFRAECSVLQKVRHRNLVRIISSCSNLDFKGLVFEFMSNGSLEKHLYPNRDDNNGEDVCELGLKKRLDIAIDVAHAIEYLHHDSFVQVVHCDLKPSNVLLDEDMSGHVTDFGIARLIDETSTESLTSTLALKGSVGYIAPESGLGEVVSTKGDIYSYGILLLEMITRKQPTSDMFSGDLNLHKWVNLAFPNRVKEVIDYNLFSEVDREEFEENNVYKCLLYFLRVGLLCSKDSPYERPTMRDVVIVLESLRNDLGGNAVASRRLRQSMSNLLSNTNATRNDTHASNAESSSTF